MLATPTRLARASFATLALLSASLGACGQEATPSADNEVRSTAENYLGALADNDYSAACRLIDARNRERIFGDGLQRCVEKLGRANEREERAGSVLEQDVASVRTDGQAATAILESGGFLHLRSRDGSWAVRLLND